MAFGIELRNGNNRTIIGHSEHAYLYWGKVTIAGGGSSYLFNIPNTVPIFAYTRATEYGVNYTLTASAGMHEVRAYGAGSITVYIFVLAKHVPLQKWGVAVYGVGRDIIWHSAGLMLCVKGTSNIIIKPKESHTVTVTGRVAHLTNHSFGEFVEFRSGATWNLFNQRTKCYDVGGNTELTSVSEFLRVEDTDAGFTFRSGGSVYVSYIDCDKYDSIPDLSAWVH